MEQHGCAHLSRAVEDAEGQQHLGTSYGDADLWVRDQEWATLDGVQQPLVVHLYCSDENRRRE